ncbi:MAG: helix-turn-helix domain-containing protein [Betaproteobacteria bacterium]|nr:helix-turn-helix domain-containing protein [Betaproteobacteria bacterium]
MSRENEAVWKALSDPVRRSILDLLRTGPQTTGALSAQFDQTRFGVMKHLKVLEAARLVLVERRGRERWNFLNAVALRQATDRWLTPFQDAWAHRLARLEQHLERGTGGMTTATGLGLDVRMEVRIAAGKARVFEALTREIGAWWVHPYRQAGPDSRLRLEPAIGEAMIETGPGGHEVIWGYVEEIRVPDLLYLSGRFAVVNAIAGRVHLDLSEDGGETILRVSHTAIGNIDDGMRANFTEGWRDLLDVRLRAHLRGVGGRP